jgi:DeoR/GlpR family transcriptional regulator of sugar metabolism
MLHEQFYQTVAALLLVDTGADAIDTSHTTVREDLKYLVDKGYISVVAVNKVKNNYTIGSEFRELIRPIRLSANLKILEDS